MKKKILFILCIVFLLAGCTKNSLDTAREYIDEEDYESALEVLINIEEEDKDEESYKLLIDIYKKESNIEKLKDVLDDYFDRGYTLEEDELIVDIFSYYDNLGNKEIIKEMLSNKNYNAKLPEEIYIKNVIDENKSEKMEIIKILIEDINNDGEDEIIVTLGEKDGSETGMDLYTRLELMIFKNDGSILYHDEGIDSHSEGISEIELIDFTGDGKKEVYYIQQHYTNFVYEVISILDIKDDEVIELYSYDEEVYDFNCIRLEENTAKLFSEALRKSYIVKRNKSINIYDTSEMRVNFEGSKVREDIEGLRVGISKHYSVWDSGGAYGDVQYICI